LAFIPANPEPFWNEFQQGLREHDYIEGQTIQFEFRSAEGKPNLLRGLADELVRLKVDIIVASQTPAPRQGRRLRKFQSSWRRRAIQSERVSSPAWRGRAATSPDCLRPQQNSE
jgi:hypothetical protein